MIPKHWTQREYDHGEQWIDAILDYFDLKHIKTSVMDVMERFFDKYPPVPSQAKCTYLNAIIMIVSKFSEDDKWLQPSDMLQFNQGPLTNRGYQRYLIDLEFKILDYINWKF